MLSPILDFENRTDKIPDVPAGPTDRRLDQAVNHGDLMKGPRGAHSAGGCAGRGNEDGAGAVEAAQAGARPREGPPAGPTPLRQGEKRGLPGHHKSVQECSWPAGLWQGGDKGPASTTQVWAPGSRHRPPPTPACTLRAPLSLHYTDGESEARRGARWLKGSQPEDPASPGLGMSHTAGAGHQCVLGP